MLTLDGNEGNAQDPFAAWIVAWRDFLDSDEGEAKVPNWATKLTHAQNAVDRDEAQGIMEADLHGEQPVLDTAFVDGDDTVQDVQDGPEAEPVINTQRQAAIERCAIDRLELEREDQERVARVPPEPEILPLLHDWLDHEKTFAQNNRGIARNGRPVVPQRPVVTFDQLNQRQQYAFKLVRYFVRNYDGKGKQLLLRYDFLFNKNLLNLI